MSNLRREVLKQFKNLLRIRETVFNGDVMALNASRLEINNNFKKNKTISDEKEIEKLVKLAKDVGIELKTNVLQAVEKKPGVFELKVKSEVLLDNVLFNENAILKKYSGPKCSDLKGKKSV